MSEALGAVGSLFTVGHSTRTLDDLVQLLKVHGVTRLADVRTVPRSRHNPQFNRDTLPAALAAAGIGYAHLPGLGGLRHARTDSSNTGWQNASFRGYADYMQTPAFTASLEQLIALVRDEQTVIMCAEAVPWRCHRSLIADALTARGLVVEHILGTSRRDRHALTPFAKVQDGRLVYPANPGQPALPLEPA
jgi:uncharacterized protein (DUF488 family)